MDWVQIGFNSVFVTIVGYLVLRLTKHMDESAKDIKLSHERLNVNDRVISSWTKSPYDSAQIAKGLQPYPVILGERGT